MDKQNFKEKFTKFHNKNYKLLLLIPLVILIFSTVYLSIFYQQNHDFFYKDISLTGGTIITINNENLNPTELGNYLSSKLENVNIRQISDLVTKKQIAVIVETKNSECNELGIKQTKTIIEDYLGYSLVEGKNSTIECTGSTFSGEFYKQLLVAILIAFFLMSIVVFIQFKSFIPSLAVIYSAFADILMSLVAINLLKIPLSTAGIVAFLMLIGYSVDTDILLTNKVLKREGKSVNQKIWESFKTGITMTLTSIVAVLAALLIVGPFSSTLFQIFLIMLFGLIADIFNTWLTNVSIIKWYALSKEKKKNEN
jgi:preprotein translocase subunit SecF